MATGQLPRAATLRIIRAALLMGVLLFGAITYYINGQRGGGQGTESAEAMRIVNIVLLVAAAVGILFIQRRHAAE
ncbi:hypothetical protein, partial [Longimicrobium sp.]|uniref:hypothetical protein n=1 Tax=Longimicrobium sp. TaxID=2029185 RepID=UPI002E328A48